MVEAALARGVNASVADMHDFELNRRFDAVFTNAVLHWTRDIDAVLRSVARHLNPGGHFVGEFGGFGNVAAIETAWHAASGLSAHPYYPTPNEFSARLAAAGFGCDLAQLIPRPTPLPTGMRAWLQTFRAYTIAHLPPAQQEEIIARAEALLQPRLCDSQGNWTADYVRLRFHATLLTAAPQPA
jgi:SAM-dependent methyltransferase